MKVYAISDLHLSNSVNKPMDIFGSSWDNYIDIIVENWEKTVSSEDIVLISGDISWAMRINDVISDLEFLHSLKGTKIIIKGNHDYWWSSLSKVRSVLPNTLIALQNDAVKINNCVFAGSRGWTLSDENSSAEDIKIYKRELIRLRLSLEKASYIRKEGDKLYCMMHYPPFNSRYNDSQMTSIIKEFNVDCVVYGHLHGSHSRTEAVVYKDNIPYYLTSCDIVKNQLIELP